jgi:signal peptidase I
MMDMKSHRLNKFRDALQQAYDWYLQQQGSLSADTKQQLESQMLNLEAALKDENVDKASQLAEGLTQLSKIHRKRSVFSYAKEVVVALLVALLLAVVVRQMWFEPYEIPTGSMRPTFREQDRITVSKTAFGLNIPLTTGHFLFEPQNVQRTSAITFTSEGIKNLDEDTPFLGIFPYKKRLIKRTIGKPGDALYFYGGKIYGVDKEGQAIAELLTAPWMENLEHIPFMKFAGKKSFKEKKSIFSQMNIPIGRIYVNRGHQIGEIYNGHTWIKDDPTVQSRDHKGLQAYSDFFGIRNFGMARLLNNRELKSLYPHESRNLGDAPLYLEVAHHPSLSYPQPSIGILDGKSSILLNPLKSIIPLEQSHIDALMQGMYTARFVIKDGHATRYQAEGLHFDKGSPRFAGVPDGMYEFINGKLYELGFGAMTSEAKPDHPLYSHDPSNVQKLFNYGIEMHVAYAPSQHNNLHFPSRYAYFRSGDLFLMGHSVITKDDPTLTAFHASEMLKEANSSPDKPYTAFKDYGPPLKDGKFDVDFIRTFGVTVPDKQYLLLGDNHAMSADSRIFGFIPEDNLQGAPSLILWPPGERWGPPSQKSYPLFTLPRLIVWSLALIAFAFWYTNLKRWRNRPIKLNKNPITTPPLPRQIS